MPHAVVNIPFLKRSHVYMKDPDNVARMIEKIRKDGANKLQIISDFDGTLTKQHIDGKHLLSSFGVFFRCQQIPPELLEKDNALYTKYSSIVMDPHIDQETKIREMECWYGQTEENIKGIELDVGDLEEVVKIHGTDVRTGTKELFQKLDVANVPVLVFSAGLGDIVELVLKRHNVALHNVKIISNFLKFKEGKLDGFTNESLIHVFNKNEHAVDKEYFKVLEGRSNVILMGDVDGDQTMADGAKDADTILKIGFLYHNEEKRLPAHMAAFDIVLVDDQTMDVVHAILETVI